MTIERLFKISISPWFGIPYIGFIVFAYFYLDKPIAYACHAWDFHYFFLFLQAFTKLGTGGFYLLTLFLVAFYFRYVKPHALFERRAWFLWLAVLVPSLICIALKIIFGRARPNLLFVEHLYGFFGVQWHSEYWSFPSGHTTTIMAFVFGLSVLFPRYIYGLISFGILVALSRIVLTNHYLSDVLIATYLTLLEIGFLLYWFRAKKWLL